MNNLEWLESMKEEDADEHVDSQGYSIGLKRVEIRVTLEFRIAKALEIIAEELCKLHANMPQRS